MRRFINILSTFREYFVLSICILISVALLTLNDNPQIRSIRSITIVAIGFAQDIFGFIPDYFSLKKENSILRERNVTLAEEASLLRESKLESIRLRQLLAMKERSPLSYIAANVIGKNQQPMRTTITLDVGEKEGVRYNMPIVTDAGLAGKIVSTSGLYSIGQLMIHKDFRVSARVQRARADGILFWDGEYMQLKNVPRTQDVKLGDVVLTSSHSTVYPEGIKIGVVSRVTVEPGALFQNITVEPAVNFSALEEVFVVVHVPDSSRVALEKQWTK